PGLTAKRVKPTPAPAAKDARIRELEAELAQARRRIADLERRGEGQVTRSHREEFGEVAGLQAENAALRDEVIELKTVLGAWRTVVNPRESAIMTLPLYKLTGSCLHPDSRNWVWDEKLAQAFRAFNRRQYVLCDEAELPTKEYAHTTKERAWIRGRKERQK